MGVGVALLEVRGLNTEQAGGCRKCTSGWIGGDTVMSRRVAPRG